MATPGKFWEHYLQLPDVVMHQAVALAMGLDPPTVCHVINLADRAQVRTFSGAPEQFREWLHIAGRWANQRNGELPTRMDGQGLRWVKLDVFARWASEKPREWDLPKWFPKAPKLALPVQDAGNASDKPLDPRERTTLLIAIAALAKKLTIDIDHPTTAAKQIVDLAETELGVKIGLRTVENSLKKAASAIEKKE